MPNPPPPYQTAGEVLDRARALFSQADQLVRQGLREEPGGRWIDDQVLTRAANIAQVAAAGAQVAHELLVREDEQAAAGEFDPGDAVLDALRDRALRERDTNIRLGPGTDGT